MKHAVNVTYTQVGSNVEVRTYPCLKFSYDPKVNARLTQSQRDNLRFRRIHIAVFKNKAKTKEDVTGIKLITKKGQWGADVVENIIQGIIAKEGEFDPKDKVRTQRMIDEVVSQVRDHNFKIMGLPKVTRDPKTGKFIKASA